MGIWSLLDFFGMWNTRLRSVLLGLLLPACAAPAPLPPSPTLHRLSVEVHADAEFTIREQAIIRTAADYLERAAGLHYRITFDLEPNAIALLENQIWRPSLDAVVVTTLDATHNGTLYGATMQEVPFRMWLLPARTPNTYTFLHVVEHELLHAVGCQHVSDTSAIMYEYTRPGVYEALRLSESDYREISRTLDGG